METQILNLKEPYEYIHCNGEVGKHIATLIVYETTIVTGTGAWVYPDACPRDYFVTEYPSPCVTCAPQKIYPYY